MKETLTRKIIYHIILIPVLLYILLPFAWLTVSSFKSKDEIFAAVPTWVIQNPTFDHYLWILSPQGGNLIPFLWNTLFVTSLTMILTMSLALTAGYSLGRYRFPGITLFVFLLFMTQMFQGPLIMIPWYKMASFFQILDTKLVLILIYGTITVPIATFIISGFYRTVPLELEEAAYIDGCSKLRTIWTVSIPLILPGIIAVSVFAFILAWNDYQYSLILTSSINSKTVQVVIMDMMSTIGNANWGGILAGGVLITLPVIILFGFTQRWLIDGLTAGAVKG
jgi:multiple sugar transport system permease protein